MLGNQHIILKTGKGKKIKLEKKEYIYLVMSQETKESSLGKGEGNWISGEPGWDRGSLFTVYPLMNYLFEK